MMKQTYGNHSISILKSGCHGGAEGGGVLQPIYRDKRVIKIRVNECREKDVQNEGCRRAPEEEGKHIGSVGAVQVSLPSGWS